MTANKTSIPRLHSVRFKDGRAPIRVLYSRVDPDREIVEDWVRWVLDHHINSPDGQDIAGFSFMVWSEDGSSTVKSLARSGNVPSILVPDFVRNRLLAAKIEEWTLDTINNG